jgi:hypothetical protein
VYVFSWLFRPTCPCDPAAKAWVEERLARLDAEFPENAFSSRPVVLPTSDYFPEPFDGSSHALQLLLNRVCSLMDVSPNQVILRQIARAGKLQFVDDQGRAVPDAPGGFYRESGGRFVITIDEAELDDASGLVGTLAHELAHARLMGEGRVTGDEFDNELLTDLATVHAGFGVFRANSPRNWECDYSRWPGTDLLRPEYMTPPMYGWALALLAFARNEMQPPWATHLSPGAHANLKQGLRFLQATRDTTYLPRAR